MYVRACVRVVNIQCTGMCLVQTINSSPHEACQCGHVCPGFLLVEMIIASCGSCTVSCMKYESLIHSLLYSNACSP